MGETEASLVKLIRIIELNDKNEVSKLEVEFNSGEIYPVEGVILCETIIKNYAKRSGKEYDVVLEELKKVYVKPEIEEDEIVDDNKKSKKIVKALAVTSAVIITLVGGCHLIKHTQKGQVVTTKSYTISTTTPTNTPNVTKKPQPTNTPYINNDKQEEPEYYSPNITERHDVDYIYDGKYQQCFNNISDWLNNKTNRVKGNPHSGYELKFSNIDGSVLYAFDVLRSFIITDAYVYNSKIQTQSDIDDFCNRFMSFVYENKPVFDDDNLLYSSMSVEAKRELIEMGLDVFSMNINKSYSINGESIDNDKAFDMINETNNELYIDEYGTNR